MRVDLVAMLMEFDVKLDGYLGPIHLLPLEIRKLLDQPVAGAKRVAAGNANGIGWR